MLSKVTLPNESTFIDFFFFNLSSPEGIIKMLSLWSENGTVSRGGEGQSISMFKLGKTAQPLMDRKCGWHGGLKMAKNSYNSSHKEVESTFPPSSSGHALWLTLIEWMGQKWRFATYKQCLQRPCSFHSYSLGFYRLLDKPNLASLRRRWHLEIEILNVWPTPCGTYHPLLTC